MDKKKREKLLIIALLPVLGYVVYSNVITKAPPPPPSQEEPEAVSSTQSSPGGKIPAPKPELRPLDEKTIADQAQIAKESWGRNPFVAAPTPPLEVGEGAEATNFQLSSVFPAQEGGAAVINGVLIEVGEFYQGFELKTVEYTRVSLGRNDEIIVLSMPEE